MRRLIPRRMAMIVHPTATGTGDGTTIAISSTTHSRSMCSSDAVTIAILAPSTIAAGIAAR